MAAVPSASSTAQVETEVDYFDYGEVKKKYERQIEMYYCNRKLPIIAPWTREIIAKIISHIKEGIRLQEAGYPSKLPKYRVMDKYEIHIENGQEKLIFKRKNCNDRIVQIVGAEDCFEIIANAHIKTKHGGHERMLKVLSQKYSVPKTSIDFILALCNVCATNKNTRFKRRADNRIPQVFHARGQVSLVDMTSEPDHQFKYILLYSDRFTKYMLLRPLVTNSESEVAMELLKIFLDIGPPKRLETYDRVYFGKVLNLVNAVYDRFNIALMLPVKLPEISANDVKKMLQKWQKKSGSRNWAMGCYVAQWESNCTVTDGHKSPYQSVFKMKPWHNLDSKDDTPYKKVDSQNNALHQSKDTYSIDVLGDDGIMITDSEDDKASITSEVAEITEANGDIITTIPLKLPQEIAPSNVLQTAAQSNTSTRVVIIDQPVKLVTGNPTPGQAVKPAQPKITQSIDDIPASMILKPPEMPEKSKCHVCKTFVIKPYICLKCKRSVHLFCSDRLMKQDVPLEILDVTCTTCILATRNDKINQKKNEIRYF